MNVSLYSPGWNFSPSFERLRLSRSFASGEYTCHDARDSWNRLDPSSQSAYDLWKSDPSLYAKTIYQQSSSYKKMLRSSQSSPDGADPTNLPPSPPDYAHTCALAGGAASLSKGTNSNASEQSITYPFPFHPTDARLAVDIAVGTQDIRVKCLSRGGTQEQLGGGVRQKISEWSDKSRRACETHIRNVPEGSIKCFLTLTYPESFPVDGKLVKKHLHNMKQWFKRRGVSGVWFLEFQRRGAPHYHAFLGSWPISGVRGVSEAWYRIVGSEDPKHLAWHLGELSGRPCLELMHKPHAASAYASKYATKADQKKVPEGYEHVGRFWGHWGGLKPVWQYVYGHGYTSFCSALHVIINFRISRGISKPCNPVTHYSSLLRGAMVEGFNFWFEDWTPF